MRQFPEDAPGIAIVCFAIVVALILTSAIYLSAGELCAHGFLSYC